LRNAGKLQIGLFPPTIHPTPQRQSPQRQHGRIHVAGQRNSTSATAMAAPEFCSAL
jgi:hypothetical protein